MNCHTPHAARPRRVLWTVTWLALLSTLPLPARVDAAPPEAPERSVPAPLAPRSLLLDGTSVEGVVVVVGERGHVLVSEQQGRSWDQGDVPTRATLTGVHFHDRKLGWAVGHDAMANPVDQLFAAADVANAMDRARLSDLLELLDADEPAIRFWGVTGLVALREEAAPATEALLDALKDPAPNVRVAAAEALCNVGRVDDAMPVLIDGLQHETAFIRLRAINVLDGLGENARPALPAIKAAGMEKKSHVGDYLGRMVQYVPAGIAGP